MRVVLNAYGDIATGIGSEARWLWNLLPFDVWIQAEHGRLGYGRDIPPDGRQIVRGGGWMNALDDNVDVVVCIERCFPPKLLEYTRFRGIKTVMLVNPEWAPADVWWLQDADVLVARTDACERHLHSIGVGYKTVRCQVPIDLREFPFRPRDFVTNVVFSNGWGGVAGRKGLAEVVEMNKLGADITIFSQRPLDVPYVSAVECSKQMYDSADLMVVPSRFEGVGLTILEAMASGCLVAATNAPPMHEFIWAAYDRLAHNFALPVAGEITVKVWGRSWQASIIEPFLSAITIAHLRSLDTGRVPAFSHMGRSYVECEHGDGAVMKLWEVITG